MQISFTKYQGTGNDFVIVDNRDGLIKKPEAEKIALLCNRRFGIGADGLMLLENEADYDFRMVYFNSDGRESSMCGNGGRCIVHFAHKNGIIGRKTHFIAIDGPHDAEIDENGKVRLKMIDAKLPEMKKDGWFIDTGSPHIVNFTSEVEGIDVKKAGALIRYNEDFKKDGVNVNFVKIDDNILNVRTYERGVEDETLSCGTGVTAVALTQALREKKEKGSYQLHTPGGELEVSFEKNGDYFQNIWLYGPAQAVFTGSFEWIRAY